MNEMAGIDWRSVFAGIPALATATAISVAWAPITGSAPAVIRRQGGYDVIFDADQEERAAEWLRIQLARGIGAGSEGPGPVGVQMGGIATKVITRTYWPYMLGIAAVGAAIGYSLRGRR